jgi:hypothetical protein
MSTMNRLPFTPRADIEFYIRNPYGKRYAIPLTIV